MKCRKKIIIALLILAIVAVNIFTGIIIYKKQNQSNNLSFGRPDYILLFKDGKQIEIKRDGKVYKSIIELNEKRDDYTESFAAVEFSQDKNNGIHLEYVFEEIFDIKLNISEDSKEQIKTYSVFGISFVLTGEDHGIMVLQTTKGEIALEKLNANAQLIKLIKEQY